MASAILSRWRRRSLRLHGFCGPVLPMLSRRSLRHRTPKVYGPDGPGRGGLRFRDPRRSTAPS
eukprot:2984477-Heterocapsa_arctica.AAC.1